MSKNSNRHFGISSFTLHIIAMASMLCDHLWVTLFTNTDILGYIGRIAFPIFAFTTVEGFFQTSDRKKYVLRLLLFALISEIPFNLMVSGSFFYPTHQNVLWTFFISILLLSLYEEIKNHRSLLLRLLLYLLSTVFFYLLGTAAFVDYYGSGVLMVALFYFTKSEKTDPLYKKCINLILQIIFMYYINCEMLAGSVLNIDLLGWNFEFPKQGFALLAIPLIWLYNGKHGPYNQLIKYTYYLFYPVHMLILVTLTMIL